MRGERVGGARLPHALHILPFGDVPAVEVRGDRTGHHIPATRGLVAAIRGSAVRERRDYCAHQKLIPLPVFHLLRSASAGRTCAKNKSEKSRMTDTSHVSIVPYFKMAVVSSSWYSVSAAHTAHLLSVAVAHQMREGVWAHPGRGTCECRTNRPARRWRPLQEFLLC